MGYGIPYVYVKRILFLPQQSPTQQRGVIGTDQTEPIFLGKMGSVNIWSSFSTRRRRRHGPGCEPQGFEIMASCGQDYIGVQGSGLEFATVPAS